MVSFPLKSLFEKAAYLFHQKEKQKKNVSLNSLKSWALKHKTSLNPWITVCMIYEPIIERIGNS